MHVHDLSLPGASNKRKPDFADFVKSKKANLAPELINRFTADEMLNDVIMKGWQVEFEAAEQAEQAKLETEQAKQQAERAKLETEQAKQQAEQAKLQTEQAKQQAEQAKQQAERAELQTEATKFLDRCALYHSQLLSMSMHGTTQQLSFVTTQSDSIDSVGAHCFAKLDQRQQEAADRQFDLLWGELEQPLTELARTKKPRREVPSRDESVPYVHKSGHLFVKSVAQTVSALLALGSVDDKKVNVKYYVEGKAEVDKARDDALFIPIGREALARREDGAIITGGDEVAAASCFDQRVQRLVKLVFEWKAVLQASNDETHLSYNAPYVTAIGECVRNYGRQIGTALPLGRAPAPCAAVIGDMLRAEFCVFQADPSSADVRRYVSSPIRLFESDKLQEKSARNLFDFCVKWLLKHNKQPLCDVLVLDGRLSSVTEVVSASSCIVLRLKAGDTSEIAKFAHPAGSPVRFDREVKMVTAVALGIVAGSLVLPAIETRLGLPALVYRDEEYVSVEKMLPELLAIADEATRNRELRAVAQAVWKDIGRAHSVMHTAKFVFVDNHDGNYVTTKSADGSYSARLCDFESTCAVGTVVSRAQTSGNAGAVSTNAVQPESHAKIFLRAAFAPVDYSDMASSHTAQFRYDDESRLYVVAFIVDYENFRTSVSTTQSGVSEASVVAWNKKKRAISNAKAGILTQIGCVS
jgi:hypothetical protein